MITAWKLYNNPKSVILFLIEDVTYNICDQKFHEFEIRKQCPEVFVVRKTLTQIGERGRLTDVSKFVSNNFRPYSHIIYLFRLFGCPGYRFSEHLFYS